MSDDHLDKETSVSVSMTETGIEARSHSRLIAAVDRLGGNLTELLNAPLERRNARNRAISAGEVAMIDAAAQAAVEKMKVDGEFASRVATNFFEKAINKQINKDEVLREAIEDLRHSPPSQQDADSGDELNEEVMSRLENYAEGATTEQLRQRWGRVVASEIRQPGRFSMKALRVIDEIDQSTALLFEKLCTNRIESGIPKCLSGELSFDNLSQLVMAGLVRDPGITGHLCLFRRITDDGGKYVWFRNEAHAGITISTDATFQSSPDTLAVIDNDGTPGIPAYLFTDAGRAIASVFTHENAFDRLALSIRAAFPETQTNYFVANGRGSFTPASFPTAAVSS